MTAPAAVPRSSKEQIILTAERLFAQHGVNGISLRQIGTEAGQANTSAVQYHFGSKAELIRGVFDYRLPGLRQRRALLIADLDPSDLRGWLECQIRAVLEQAELQQSHYMGFVASLIQHGFDDFAHLPPKFADETAAFDAHLRDHLSHLVEPIRSHRLAQAMILIIHAAADRERAIGGGHQVLPFGAEVSNLLDGMAGFLSAPASPATVKALRGAAPPGLPRKGLQVVL